MGALPLPLLLLLPLLLPLLLLLLPLHGGALLLPQLLLPLHGGALRLACMSSSTSAGCPAFAAASMAWCHAARSSGTPHAAAARTRAWAGSCCARACVGGARGVREGGSGRVQQGARASSLNSNAALTPPAPPTHPTPPHTPRALPAAARRRPA